MKFFVFKLSKETEQVVFKHRHLRTVSIESLSKKTYSTLFFKKKTKKAEHRINKQITSRNDHLTALNLLLKKGLKKKYATDVLWVFNSFFLNFLNFNSNLHNKYEFYSMFYNFSKTSSNFYNLNFVTKFLKTSLAPLFDLKIVTISSKIRKRRKSNIKVQFDVKYLKPHQRTR